MDNAVYILKILYHLLCTFLIYGLARTACGKSLTIHAGSRILYTKDTNSRSIILGSFLIICLLEGIYSFICGPYHVYLADRRVFANRFVGGYYTKAASIGLYYLQDFLRLFTNNPDVLFFVVAFIFMAATLLAYNTSKDSRPMALLYMCMSQYMLYGCYQLKQALAAAFAGLAIVLFLDNKKALSIIASVLAIMFHETAFVLVPLFIVIYGSKSKIIKYSSYAFLILFVFFFSRFSMVGIRIFTNLIPDMANQVSIYLDETGGLETGGSILTAIKGLPIYYITYIGFSNRDRLRNRIINIDKYLLICVFASVATLSTTFMSWMWRFSELVYFPVFIFAALMRDELETKRKREYDLIICFSLAIFTYRKLIMSYFIYGGLV